MKTTIAILLLAFFAGCAPEDREMAIEWVIERQGRSPSEIQADLDVMAAHEFRVRDDDDLEQSGHYILFVRVVVRAQKDDIIRKIQADLAAARARKP